MGIRRRIERLEGRGGQCAVCGWGPDMQVDVIWDDGWGDTPDSPDETTYCEACGRPDHIVITWVM